MALRTAAQGSEQMIIDAGQKAIGSRQCEVCSFFFTPGDAGEERLHRKHHSDFLGVISFRQPWKGEHLAVWDEAEDFRVLVVHPQDPKRHWERAQSVLAVVNEALGVAEDSSFMHLNRRPEVYLAICEKRVAGCILAEDITDKDHVQKSFIEKGVR